ncbi:hypothetical protein [Burkholderia anthina]|uniref:hypothetical protein n=1 Tax=Burkholderia anthina TaxID=179879 RepID=UPI00163B5290|nr:hypothetical protein [Burkholderia anthina]
MIGPPRFCQHPLVQGCEWTVKDRQTKSCSGVCHVDAAAIGAQTADCRSNACESVRLAACVLDEQVGEIARETRRRIEIGDADLEPALGSVVFERDETRRHHLRMTARGAFGQHADVCFDHPAGRLEVAVPDAPAQHVAGDDADVDQACLRSAHDVGAHPFLHVDVTCG